MKAQWHQRLTNGAAALGVTLTDKQVQQLLDYLQELHKWNRAYNLSAIRDPDLMLQRHLLDSLAVLPHLQAGRVIDVGTGAGLPGIVLAICQPATQITLLDSNGKKTRFIFHVKTLLQLDNVRVENCRVEQHQPDELYQVVISRAFASLADMTSSCRHLLGEGGVFYAMKGVYPEAELEQAEALCQLQTGIRLQVPGEVGERHLLVLRPV